jgi:hypothetical protein
MYVNKCIKCGREFETKNPKRVICPDCLYPDKNMMVNSEADGQAPKPQETTQPQPSTPLSSYSTEEVPRYYSAGGDENRYNRPQRQYNNNREGGYNRPQGNYNRDGGGYNRNQGGYNRPQGGYNRDGGGYNRNQGGYNRPQGGYNRDSGGYNRNQGGYNRPQGGYNRDGGGYNNRPQQGRFNNNRRPMMNNRSRGPKQLLVSKEQLAQIEILYKAMLPLPNPDAHEVIGEKISLEPRKVFFGINLIRQKLMLPKLPYPKRKLAISPDQLFAIKNLYEPLLPLPPIGCHKIIAAQLKMDEWRVHVGIGLIRSQMGLERWNPDRADAPAEFKNQKKEVTEPTTDEKKVKKTSKKAVEEKKEEAKEEAPAEEKPKRGRKKKTEEPEG